MKLSAPVILIAVGCVVVLAQTTRPLPNRPTLPPGIGALALDATVMFVDEYVHTIGSPGSVYSLDTVTGFQWSKLKSIEDYGTQGLGADRRGTVYGVNWVGLSRPPFLFVATDNTGRKWTGPLVQPSAVACDRQGRIYVVDSSLSQVIRIDDMSGKNLMRFGNPGSIIGQLNHPQGIAIGADNKIYIADTGNSRIVMIEDMNGEGWRTYNGLKYGGEGKQVGSVKDIAVDSKGRIYYCRADNGLLIRIDDMFGNNMKWYGGFAGPTAASGRKLVSPSGIAIDLQDRIYVSDSGMAAVLMFNDITDDRPTWLQPDPGTKKPFRPTHIAAYLAH